METTLTSDKLTHESVPSGEPKEGEVLLPERDLAPAVQRTDVQVSLPSPVTKRRRWHSVALILMSLGAGAAALGYWWHVNHLDPAPGFTSGNGRIEAQEIDIETKFAGRLLEHYVEEGDQVAAGQVVARMDTRDLEASLKALESQAMQAQHSLDEAKANVVQQTAIVTLAQQELNRTANLVTKGFATGELLDQRRQSLDSARATLNGANERVNQASHALDSSRHNVDLTKINIADNTLVAPTVGRIQYRITNDGEVLPVGGKVFTMLDTSDVYIDIYLPTPSAGRVQIGSDARILLDAWPSTPIAAHVTFIATQAQFTPKAVETMSERDKLMFRIKVRVDRGLLLAHAAEVRTGLPGRAFVRLEKDAQWPKFLQAPSS